MGSEKKKVEEKQEEEQDIEVLAQAARIQRGRDANAKIQAILEEYKCTILPMVTIVGTQIVQAGIQITPQ